MARSRLNEEIPISLKDKILSERDLGILDEYLDMALEAKTIKDFMERIQQ